MLLLTSIIIILIIFIIYILYNNTNSRSSSYNYETEETDDIGVGQNIELSPELSDNDIINLKKGQKKMTNILYEFDRICRKYDLKYWCIGGTLIGVLRHKGWIPWDGDMDVGMIDTDYKKLENVIDKELPDNMWFQNTKKDKHYTNYAIAKIRDLNSCYKSSPKDSHNGLQLDIFLFKKDKNILISDLPEFNQSGFDYSYIFPLKEKLFENIKVYIPNKYEKYSKKVWGDEIPKLLDINERLPDEGLIDPNNTCEHHYKLYPNLY